MIIERFPKKKKTKRAALFVSCNVRVQVHKSFVAMIFHTVVLHPQQSTRICHLILRIVLLPWPQCPNNNILFLVLDLEGGEEKCKVIF